MQITFIGLGKMGLPLARHLLDADYELAVYNRTAAKADPLVKAGAKLAASARAAVEGSEVVITMLADDLALNTALEGQDGALEGLGRDALHISMSTISVQLSKQLTQRHAALGHQYVAAPVFGRPQAAEAKQLGILAAGSQEAIKRARPVLEAMGKSVLEVGDAPFLANTVKLAGNTLLVAMLQALGEAFALVRKSGLSPQHFLEIVNGAVFKSPVYENYGGTMAAQSYTPAGFELSQGLKDLGLVLAAAEQTRAPMPLAALIQAQALSGMARGWDDLDWSALGKVCAHNAGLDGE